MYIRFREKKYKVFNCSRLRCISTNFASITSPPNGLYPCIKIPLVFYLIRKGSISLGKYLLGVSLDHDLNEANHPTCHQYLGTTIFLPAFHFVSKYLLVSVCLGLSLYLMDYSEFVCVYVCTSLIVNSECMWKCILGRKKIRRYICLAFTF